MYHGKEMIKCSAPGGEREQNKKEEEDEYFCTHIFYLFTYGRTKNRVECEEGSGGGGIDGDGRVSPLDSECKPQNSIEKRTGAKRKDKAISPVRNLI